MNVLRDSSGVTLHAKIAAAVLARNTPRYLRRKTYLQTNLMKEHPVLRLVVGIAHTLISIMFPNNHAVNGR